MPDFNLDGNTVNSGVIRRMRARRAGQEWEHGGKICFCAFLFLPSSVGDRYSASSRYRDHLGYLVIQPRFNGFNLLDLTPWKCNVPECCCGKSLR